MNNVLKITLWGYDVGRLVWDDKERRAFFSFSPSFLSAGYDIAPLTASISKPYLRQGGIYKGNIQRKIYKGLPEFLADSLPDRWGESLISRWQHENMPDVKFTPVDALAFMGKRAMGALEFEPCFDQWSAPVDLELSCLYKIADDILNERSEAVDNLNSASMQSLYLVGTSAGGMQPKAIIAINEDDGTVKSGQIQLEGNFKYYILKFDRVGRFPYTLMEKTYYDMALACGIKMMPSRLITIDGHSHFITERFDRAGKDKLHIQTLAALSPDADCYEDLMKTAR
ncbi:MAG: HipA N-terminal domain-containing protein, partial [Prevotellaceae bacterium]|nr:HipA N-terminal domain-containing protein [Prevotellaceae bacterium]